jgi:hypothetical protein
MPDLGGAKTATLSNDLDILVRSRELLERSWTKGDYAKTVGGTPIMSASTALSALAQDPSSCRLCLLGGLAVAYKRRVDPPSDAIDVLCFQFAQRPGFKILADAVKLRDGSVNLATYNDAGTTGHGDILSLLDDGIAILRAELRDRNERLAGTDREGSGAVAS